MPIESDRTKNLQQITIVTPSFNQGQFLRETICSVLQQNYQNLEFIVIDGGSSDNSVDIVRQYESQIAYWISEADAGQAYAINKGWERATGNILTWLNSDDTLLPDALAIVGEYLIRHPEVDIIFGDTLFTDADGKPLRRSKPRTDFDYYDFVITCENPIPQPSAFIRRSVIKDIGLLNVSYHNLMDWDYWLRAGLAHRIAYLPELLSTYRLHPASKTLTQSRKAAIELERMYNDYFARNDLPPMLRRQRRKAMANMYFTSGNYCLEAGDRGAAARAARRAVAQYPQLLFHLSMLHKLLYCYFGSSAIYSSVRNIFYRLMARRPRTATSAG